ncbi:unnamed protein product [marine sediment metagenome]|uniref:Uncharacterized protein n=1 Tax=marine sediment metagenome TaxID=412755 RepID=X1MX14_9ZZZZ
MNKLKITLEWEFSIPEGANLVGEAAELTTLFESLGFSFFEALGNKLDHPAHKYASSLKLLNWEID